MPTYYLCPMQIGPPYGYIAKASDDALRQSRLLASSREHIVTLSSTF